MDTHWDPAQLWWEAGQAELQCLLFGIKAPPEKLQAKLMISIRTSPREGIRWNEAADREMPLPASPPRDPKSLSHASRRGAASWVWILAPPELSGLPHSQEKGSLSWQANLQSHGPTAQHLARAQAGTNNSAGATQYLCSTQKNPN